MMKFSIFEYTNSIVCRCVHIKPSPCPPSDENKMIEIKIFSVFLFPPLFYRIRATIFSELMNLHDGFATGLVFIQIILIPVERFSSSVFIFFSVSLKIRSFYSITFLLFLLLFLLLSACCQWIFVVTRLLLSFTSHDGFLNPYIYSFLSVSFFLKNFSLFVDFENILACVCFRSFLCTLRQIRLMKPALSFISFNTIRLKKINRCE